MSTVTFIVKADGKQIHEETFPITGLAALEEVGKNVTLQCLTPTDLDITFVFDPPLVVPEA
jgi:hypothetical protein